MRFGSLVTAALVVLLSAAAGCSGSPRAQDGKALADGLFDETTGAIQGLVTDDQLLPLSNAIVELDGAIQVRTGADGRFEIGPIPPGPHVLLAGANGFKDQELSVNIAAGAATTTNFVLFPIGGSDPYYEAFPKAGFIACSVGYRGPGIPGRYAAICAIPTFIGLPSIDNSLNAFNAIGMSADVVGITFETTWQSTQALGNRLEIVVFVHDVPLPDPTGDYNSTSIDGPGDEGLSPLREPVNRTHLDSLLMENRTSLCADSRCFFEIGHYANADRSAAADIRIVLQQRFEDFVTVFHGGTFDPEFSILPDR